MDHDSAVIEQFDTLRAIGQQRLEAIQQIEEEIATQRQARIAQLTDNDL